MLCFDVFVKLNKRLISVNYQSQLLLTEATYSSHNVDCSRIVFASFASHIYYSVDHRMEESKLQGGSSSRFNGFAADRRDPQFDHSQLLSRSSPFH